MYIYKYAHKYIKFYIFCILMNVGIFIENDSILSYPEGITFTLKSFYNDRKYIAFICFWIESDVHICVYVYT